MTKHSIAGWFIAIGIILFIWHYPLPGIWQQIFFFPMIGFGLIVTAVIVLLTSKKEKLELGDKRLWIPLSIIAISIAFSGIEAFIDKRIGIEESFSIVATGAVFFALYLVSRNIGDIAFKPMPYVVIIESISIPIYSWILGWKTTGGLLSPTNYDIATFLIVFGILVSPKNMRWWLSIIGSVGLLFSGSGEAIFVGLVLLILALFSKIELRKIIYPIAAVIIISISLMGMGIFSRVQAPNVQRLAILGVTYNLIPGSDYWNTIKKDTETNFGVIVNTTVVDQITGYRQSNTHINSIKPFGYGLNLTRFYWGIPHNIILIIIEQVGILAAIAWLWVVAYQTFTTPYKYAWLGLLFLGVLDHFVWTQAAPYFWVLAGVSNQIKRI